MRKVVSNIFVALFILCFASQKGFALGREGCSTLDWLCQISGKGAKSTTSSDTTIKKSKKDLKKKEKKLTRKFEKSNTYNTEFNIFTGMFDFSDHKQKAGILGLQHQNEELYRKSFFGKFSPITGGFLTESKAVYLYTGIQAEYELGFLTITPSFTPGYYNAGDGKDLGYPLEFKSEVQMTFDLSDTSHMGMSYNHISNASLGSKNPGANSYMLNFLKQF